jgi:precorrin isomerase
LLKTLRVQAGVIQERAAGLLRGQDVAADLSQVAAGRRGTMSA